MENKVIVITGGSRGLGEALARIFASKKARVVISGRDTKELQRVSKETGAIAIAADVTKEDDVVELARKTIAQFGKIDIWINNAGVWLPRALAEEMDMKRAHDIFEVNVFGVAYGSRAALVQLKKQKQGTIVNVISSAALTGRPNSSMYSASKHAAKGFTDSIREEVKGTGITVIGVYPGGFKSNLFDEDKPQEFDDFMTTESVALKIIENLLKPKPETEQILKRPGQS